MSDYSVVVAIPARDEAELLPHCLTAIGAQTGTDLADVAVVVSANNCTDDSAARARALGDTLPFKLFIDEVILPYEIAHAGGARRDAMDAAARRCRWDGVILTTDADGTPDEDWIAGYLEAFAPGAAAVAGRVSTNWEELQRFPEAVLDIGAREWEYQGLAAELEAHCDPEAHDPWPRHNQTCGANAGITKAWYERIGGLPLLRTGEDSAMFREVWCRDGQIRHDMRPHVTVSARLAGRAQGGMADALTARHGDKYLCDDLLEPADDLARRSRWRHAARDAFQCATLRRWAIAQGAGEALARTASEARHFGEAWQFLESRWPTLTKRRIAAAGLDAELTRIKQLLADARVKRPESLDR